MKNDKLLEDNKKQAEDTYKFYESLVGEVKELKDVKEVVEKTMNVVKELVENSIDAKASMIKIELIDSGVAEIKVTDDGIGMDKEDALLAFSRHATSKLKTLDDLVSLLDDSINPDAPLTLKEGNLIISATIKPTNASVKDIIWTSNDSTIATVNDGTIVAKKEGTVKYWKRLSIT